MKVVTVLNGKICDCHLDPLEAIVERNSENIINLQYDLTNMDENFNTMFEVNNEEIQDIKETLAYNQNQMENVQSTLDFVLELLSRQGVFLKNLGYIEYETIQGVLSNSAQIERLENELNHFVPDSGATVIFSAQRTQGKNFDGWVTFDQANVNVGEGMDFLHGKFLTPASGIYSFTFSGITGYTQTSYTTIDVLKNGIQAFKILHDARGQNQNSGGKGNNLSYSWMLDLKANDVIQLYISHNAMYADAENHVIFTGQLIKSSLDFSNELNQ